MKTLLIFDSFGENDLKFYMIPDAPEWLSSCHEQYANTESDEHANLWRVCSFVREPNPGDGVFSDHHIDEVGKWMKYEINHSEICGDIEPPGQVVITGLVP